MQEDLTKEELSRLKEAAQTNAEKGSVVADLVLRLIAQVERAEAEIDDLTRGYAP